MKKRDWKELAEEAMGSSLLAAQPLSGGCVGEVYKATFKDGRKAVLKVDSGKAPKLDVEARMLRYLGEVSTLPVPEVFWAAPEFLMMEFLENDGRGGPEAEEEAAEMLASLHEIGAERYGFHEDTLIGGLALSNQEDRQWPRFFARKRLLAMGEECLNLKRIDGELFESLAQIAERSEALNGRSRPPGLIHGDVWSGNVLFHQGRVAGFIDPAIYYADPEVELAFITLFDTFGERFFARYGELRGIEDGFFEVRRVFYNLFPLLVHVRLFGGSYRESLRASIDRLRGECSI